MTPSPSASISETFSTGFSMTPGIGEPEGGPSATFLAEQAGGRGSTGEIEIRDVVPTSLHQRIPLYLGSKEYVDLAEQYVKQGSLIAAR